MKFNGMSSTKMDRKVFFIAEIGVNHNGDLDLARRLIDVAAEAGCDAAKFQTFKADKLVVAGAEMVAYQKASGTASDQHQLLDQLELSESDHRKLISHCQDAGIEFMSTAFDVQSLEMLIQLGVKRLKIPSGEIGNIALIQQCARSNLPLIISTGMAYLEEISTAIDAVTQVRDINFENADVVILHCTSAYPTELSDVNLSALSTIRSAFNLPVGYSDHTLDIVVAPLAVAAGATIVEKHITLDRGMQGPDHAASIEPHELKILMEKIKQVEIVLGDGIKAPREAEMEARTLVRRGLKFASDLPAGHILTEDDFVLLRPDTGLSPVLLPTLIGHHLKRKVSEFDAVNLDDIV